MLHVAKDTVVAISDEIDLLPADQKQLILGQQAKGQSHLTWALQCPVQHTTQAQVSLGVGTAA